MRRGIGSSCYAVQNHLHGIACRKKAQMLANPEELSPSPYENQVSIRSAVVLCCLLPTSFYRTHEVVNAMDEIPLFYA
jgi:hypothetical protein